MGCSIGTPIPTLAFWGHWDLRQTLNSLSHRAATRSEPTPTEQPQIESVVSLVKALWIERGCESLGSLRTGGSCWCSAWRVIQGSDTAKDALVHILKQASSSKEPRIFINSGLFWRISTFEMTFRTPHTGRLLIQQLHAMQMLVNVWRRTKLLLRSSWISSKPLINEIRPNEWSVLWIPWIDCQILHLNSKIGLVFNGHSRILNWRYLPYIRPI